MVGVGPKIQGGGPCLTLFPFFLGEPYILCENKNLINIFNYYFYAGKMGSPSPLRNPHGGDGAKNAGRVPHPLSIVFKRAFCFFLFFFFWVYGPCFLSLLLLKSCFSWLLGGKWRLFPSPSLALFWQWQVEDNFARN